MQIYLTNETSHGSWFMVIYFGVKSVLSLIKRSKDINIQMHNALYSSHTTDTNLRFPYLTTENDVLEVDVSRGCIKSMTKEVLFQTKI